MHCYKIIIIKIQFQKLKYVTCKDMKIRGPNPLKFVRPTPPNWAQTDKYLLREWGKQGGLKSEDSNRKGMNGS